MYSLGMMLAELAGETPRDLRTIIGKATDPDPRRRYESVERFAADLRNYVEGRPVEARGASWWYQAGRFVARNRVAAAGVAVAVVSLAAGSGVAIWKARVADRERTRAVRRFRDVQELSRSLIFDLHDVVAKLPGGVEARRVVVKTALKYLDGLQLEESGDDSLDLDVAAAYVRIAKAQWASNEPNLGEQDAARENYRKAIALLQRRWARHPFEDATGVLLTNAISNGAQLETDERRVVEELEKLLPIHERWLAARPSDPEALDAAVTARTTLAQRLSFMGDHHRARLEGLRALELARRAIAGGMPTFERVMNLARSSNAAAAADGKMGNIEAAALGYEQGRTADLWALRLEPGNIIAEKSVGIADSRQTEYYSLLGRFPEADRAGAAAVLRLTKIAAADRRDTNAQKDLGMAYDRRGRLRRRQGRLRAAIADFEAAVAVFDRVPSEATSAAGYCPRAINDLGLSLFEGRDPRAASLFHRALSLVADDAGNIEFLRERARAYYGLALTAPSGDARQDMARRSVEVWRELRRRSPADREGIDEERLAEALAAQKQ